MPFGMQPLFSSQISPLSAPAGHDPRVVDVLVISRVVALQEGVLCSRYRSHVQFG